MRQTDNCGMLTDMTGPIIEAPPRPPTPPALKSTSISFVYLWKEPAVNQQRRRRYFKRQDETYTHLWSPVWNRG